MQKSNKKMIRMLAVILTLTMLMSAMMVQAFAAQEAEEDVQKSSVSGTFLGLPAYTNVWLSGDTGYIYASSGYMAGIDLYIRVGFAHPSIWIGDTYADSEGTYCYYEATLSRSTPDPEYTEATEIFGETTITYNGSTWGTHDMRYSK